MISIIISSCNQQYFTALQGNISNTIGVEYEIIKIHNPGKMSICEAYNRGVEKAKYSILCFAHEDIEFKTENWGSKVLDIFSSAPHVGLLGAAGNIYKSLTPSHWSFPDADKNSFYVNVIQGDLQTVEPIIFYANPTNVNLQQVAAIDGFWFCAPKDVILEFPFDSKTCTGFHGYDVDISLSVQKKYKVAVTFDILIQHFSTGNFKRDWMDSILKVHKKWKNELPLQIDGYKELNQKKEETKALLFFSKLMLDNHYNLLKVLSLFRFRNNRFRFSLKEFLTIIYPLIRSKYQTTAKNYKGKLFISKTNSGGL